MSLLKQHCHSTQQFGDAPRGIISQLATSNQVTRNGFSKMVLKHITILQQAE